MDTGSVPPPQKRPRLSHEPSINNLFRARERNAGKLKSRFESIFAKYEKDFTGLGDEIDIVTGKIVINNGHLLTMSAESDDHGDVDELAEPGVTPTSSALQTEDAAKPFQFATPRRPLQKTPTTLSKLGGRLAALQAERDLDDNTRSSPRAATPRAATPRASTPGGLRATPFVVPRPLSQLDNVYFSPRGKTPGPSLAAISRATPCPFETPAPKKTSFMAPPTESRWKTPLLFSDLPGQPTAEEEHDEEDVFDCPNSRSPSPEQTSIWIDAPSRDTSPQPPGLDGVDSEDIRRSRWKPKYHVAATGLLCKADILDEARRDMKAAEASYWKCHSKVQYFRRKWLREAGLLLFDVPTGKKNRSEARQRFASVAVEITENGQPPHSTEDGSASSYVPTRAKSDKPPVQRKPRISNETIPEPIDHSYTSATASKSSSNANFFKDRLKRQRKLRQFSDFLRTDHSILEDGTLVLPESAQKNREGYTMFNASNSRSSNPLPLFGIDVEGSSATDNIASQAPETTVSQRMTDNGGRTETSDPVKPKKKRRRKTTGAIDSGPDSVIDLLANPELTRPTQSFGQSGAEVMQYHGTTAPAHTQISSMSAPHMQKKGRKRKSEVLSIVPSTTSGIAVSPTPGIVKRPRGRPRKSAPAALGSQAIEASIADVASAPLSSPSEATQPGPAKQFGKPRVVLDSQATTAAPLSSVTARGTPRKRLVRKSGLTLSSFPDQAEAEAEAKGHPDPADINTQETQPFSSTTPRPTPRKRRVNKSSLLSSSFPLPAGTEDVLQDLETLLSTIPESTQDGPAPLDAEADQLSTPQKQRTTMLPVKLRVLGSSPRTTVLKQKSSQGVGVSQSTVLSDTRSSEFDGFDPE